VGGCRCQPISHDALFKQRTDQPGTTMLTESAHGKMHYCSEQPGRFSPGSNGDNQRWRSQ
jgi:hypothetical protein